MDDEQLGPSAHTATRERAGRLTTHIPRPAHRRASDAGRSRLGDLRRRGPKGDRISTRRSAWLFGLAALVVAGSIGAALFGLPVRTWFDQEDQIRALEHELDEMQSVNDDLETEVARLQTDEGVREAAREELGQMQAGEHRRTVLEHPPLPRTMPAGWPYSQVDRILTLRAEAAAAAAAAAATTSVAPATAPVAPTTAPAAAPATPTSPTTPATVTTVAAGGGG